MTNLSGEVLKFLICIAASENSVVVEMSLKDIIYYSLDKGESCN